MCKLVSLPTFDWERDVPTYRIPTNAARYRRGRAKPKMLYPMLSHSTMLPAHSFQPVPFPKHGYRLSLVLPIIASHALPIILVSQKRGEIFQLVMFDFLEREQVPVLEERGVRDPVST